MAVQRISKDEAIVLHSLRYGDHSLIVRAFTRSGGLRSFVVKHTGRRKGNGSSVVLFQPLTLLELLFVPENGSNGLNTVREVRMVLSPLLAVPEMLRSSVALFVADVLNQCMRHQEADAPLFQFIETNVRLIIEANEKRLHDIPLQFLIQLAGLLGFDPLLNFNKANQIFDLIEGRFVADAIHGHYIPANWSDVFVKMTMNSRNNLIDLGLPSGSRSLLLSFMVEYFQLQIPGMGEIKSHRVLHEVLLG